MNNWFFQEEFFNSHYNCNAYSQEKWATFGERHPILGIYFITFGVLSMALYMLFIFAIGTNGKFRSIYAYKMMLVLGFIDLVNIFVSSISTGFLAYVGAVYCTWPKFNYFSGLFGVAGWCSGTVIICMLGFNRCVEWTSQYWGEMLFASWRGYIWLIAPCVYFWYIVIFEHALFFDSVYGTWFHHPFKHIPELTYNQQLYYSNTTHSINNSIISFLLIFINGYLIYKVMSLPAGMASSMAMKKNFLVQVIWICAICLFTSLAYLFMNLVYLPPWICIAGSVGYQWNSGSPAYIYLIMNKSLRTEAFRLIKRSFGVNSGTNVVGPPSASVNPKIAVNTITCPEKMI